MTICLKKDRAKEPGAVSAADVLTGRRDLGTGAFGTVGNILWLVFAGIWLAAGHLVSAAACAVTLIGLPFAWQHVKLAGLALWPIGRMVVAVDVAAAARQAHAREELRRMRREWQAPYEMVYASDCGGRDRVAGRAASFGCRRGMDGEHRAGRH